MGPQTLSHTSTKEAVNTDVCKKKTISSSVQITELAHPWLFVIV